jgi:GH25 family lysozyme M1 (1,4-beta-N-acetylmuramidase)
MILGLDTASVAGNKKIDWAEARSAGLTFALLRSNYGDQQDTRFAKEWDRARDAGFVRGAYMFVRFPRAGKKAPEPEKQAKAMIHTLGDIMPNDLPPIIDLEFPGKGRIETGMSVVECFDWACAVRDVLLKEYGVHPILYTSARVWRDDLANLGTFAFIESPLWLARYPFKAGAPVMDPMRLRKLAAPPVPPPWGDQDNWWLHQYQGNVKGAPGFDGLIDLNRFNVLKRDMSGARTAWLCSRLGVPCVTTFNDCIEDEVIDFQAAHGLVPDGIVGPRTFAYLCWQKL